MKKCIRLCPADNVATLLAGAEQGDILTVTNPAGTVVARIRAESPVPAFHKLALTDIAMDAPVTKMDTVIGVSSQHIPSGTHVHVHNVLSIEGRKGAKQ